MEKTGKRGRPKKENVMETIAVRLPFEIILEIDNYVNKLKKQFQGMNITRADAIRQLINNGLNANPKESKNPDIEIFMIESRQSDLDIDLGQSLHIRRSNANDAVLNTESVGTDMSELEIHREATSVSAEREIVRHLSQEKDDT